MKLSDLISKQNRINESGKTNSRVEKLARELPPGLTGEEILDAAYKAMVASRGKKEADFYFHVDEDFPSDVVSEYLKIHKVSESEGLNEDWGSSDWYPVLKSMAEALLAGAKERDAAYEAGVMHKEHMGHSDDAQGDEDMIESVLARWIRLPADRKEFFMNLAKENKEKMEKIYAAARANGGRDPVTNEAVTTSVYDLLNIDAVREHRKEFLDLLNQWKAIIAKEHSSYMRRGTGGKSDWYTTRSAFKRKMDSISSEFQKLFAKQPNSKKYSAIDTFDFTHSTPFQFWKQLTSHEEGSPLSTSK